MVCHGTALQHIPNNTKPTGSCPTHASQKSFAHSIPELESALESHQMTNEIEDPRVPPKILMNRPMRLAKQQTEQC